jgi:hypothetical protein
MLHVPQPLMRCHQAFLCATLPTIRRRPWPPHHEFQDIQQGPRRLDITLVAGVVECDQHMIGKTSRSARGWAGLLDPVFIRS